VISENTSLDFALESPFRVNPIGFHTEHHVHLGGHPGALHRAIVAGFAAQIAAGNGQVRPFALSEKPYDDLSFADEFTQDVRDGS
jgi:hypothetical protein